MQKTSFCCSLQMCPRRFRCQRSATEAKARVIVGQLPSLHQEKNARPGTPCSHTGMKKPQTDSQMRMFISPFLALSDNGYCSLYYLCISMLWNTARECIYKREFFQDAESFYVSLIFKNCVFLLFKFWVKYSCVPLLLNLSFCNQHWETCIQSLGICWNMHFVYEFEAFVVAFLLISSGENTAFMLQNTQSDILWLELPFKCSL